jgi:beta-alanine--pyruvate transaminase
MTTAKGLTNGCVPAGAVFVKREIHDALMTGPEHVIELFHGYTYSGHPLACAAGLATLDIYAKENLLTRGAELSDYWADKLHSLRDAPNVIDVRHLGLVAGVELKPRDGAPGTRGYDVFLECFKNGALVRFTGDIIAMSPPLIVEKSHIDRIIEVLAAAIRKVA